MSVCRSCKAEIVWAVSEKTGKRLPLDPIPVPTGNLQIVGEAKGTPLVRFDLDGDGPKYLTHFVTCPAADDHRRPR